MSQDAFNKAAAVVLQEARARLTAKQANWGAPYPGEFDLDLSMSPGDTAAAKSLGIGPRSQPPVAGPAPAGWSGGPPKGMTQWDHNPEEFHLSGMDPAPAAGPGPRLPAKGMPAPAAPGRAGFGGLLGRLGRGVGGALSRGGWGGGLARLGTGLAAGAGLNALNNYMRPAPAPAGGIKVGYEALLQEARHRLAVKQADMPTAMRNALLGAALGGGAGFAYDRLARDPKDRNGLGSAIAGAGLGAAGGAASPAIADALSGTLGGSAVGSVAGGLGGGVAGLELRDRLPREVSAPGGVLAGAPVGGVIGGATGALSGGAIGGLSGLVDTAQQDSPGKDLLTNALAGLVLGGGVGAAHEMTKDKKDRNLLRGAARGGAIGAAGTAAGSGIGRMLAGGLGGAAGGAVGGGVAGAATGAVTGGIAGNVSDQQMADVRAELDRQLQRHRAQQ